MDGVDAGPNRAGPSGSGLVLGEIGDSEKLLKVLQSNQQLSLYQDMLRDPSQRAQGVTFLKVDLQALVSLQQCSLIGHALTDRTSISTAAH